MVRLIVHADDFGLTEHVNAGIVQAHREGILTSASITANGVAFAQAITLARANPSLDVGIHLTLVEEMPVLHPESIPSLVERDGRFPPHASNFFLKYLSGRIRLAEIRRELEAQIQKILATGIRVTHFDSHQHLHVLPGILRLTAELAATYGVPAIRLPDERLPLSVIWNSGSLARLLQMRVLGFFCRRGARHVPLRPDHFFGFWWGGRLNRENLRSTLQLLPSQGTCELMCHPGKADHDSAYRHWNYQWQEELEALTDAGIAAFIRERGIRLCSYRELGGEAVSQLGS